MDCAHPFPPGFSFDAYRRTLDFGLDSFVRVTVLNQEGDLPQSAELDRIAFDGQVGASAQELGRVARHGFALGIKDKHGRLLAQAHVATESIPDAQEVGLANLRPKHAYFEGLSTHPAARGRGYAQVLIAAAEDVLQVRAPNITHMLTTIRPTNYGSQRAFTRCGYSGVAYASDYYLTNGTDGDRILFAKRLHMLLAMSPSSPVAESTVVSESGQNNEASLRMRSAFWRYLMLSSVERYPGDSTKFVANFTRRQRWNYPNSVVPESVWLLPENRSTGQY